MEDELKCGEPTDPLHSFVEETPLSMLELRQNAADIMKGLDQGMKYTLTYRGRTVGKLIPPPQAAQSVPNDDAIYHLEHFISDGPEGSLSNDDIDRVIYGL